MVSDSVGGSEAWESAFLTSCQAMLMLLAWELHMENDVPSSFSLFSTWNNWGFSLVSPKSGPKRRFRTPGLVLNLLPAVVHQWEVSSASCLLSFLTLTMFWDWALKPISFPASASLTIATHYSVLWCLQNLITCWVVKWIWLLEAAVFWRKH